MTTTTTLLGASQGWRLAQETEGDSEPVIVFSVPGQQAAVAFRDGWFEIRLSSELFRSVCSEYTRHAAEKSEESKPDQFEKIVAGVSRMFGLRVGKVLTDRQGRSAARARHLIWFVARKHTVLSFPEIAQPFGMDHTSVLKAVRKVGIRVRAGDQEWINAIRTCEDALGLPHEPSRPGLPPQPGSKLPETDCEE